MKIEEGKYYRTADGKKVGPARIITEEEEPFYDFEWGRMVSCGQLYEIVGVLPEDTLDTDLVAEWVDEYRPWKDLTDAEKGELLLSAHEGGRVERFCEFRQEWVGASLNCGEQYAYRVNTDPIRKTVVMVGKTEDFYGEYSFHQCDNVTSGYSYKIIFDLVDGEPDCDSVKMEKL